MKAKDGEKRAKEIEALYPPSNRIAPLQRKTYYLSDGNLPPRLIQSHYVTDAGGNRITVDLPLSDVKLIVESVNQHVVEIEREATPKLRRYRLLAHIIVLGNPATKKTGQRIVRGFKGKPAIRPSLIYERWEKDLLSMGSGIFQARPACKLPIDRPVGITAHYYRVDRMRSDLTGHHQAMQDALVKAGVLMDDYWGIVHDLDGSEVRFDKENPRMEVFIYALK